MAYRRQQLIDPVKLELLQDVLLVHVPILAVAHELRLVEVVEDASLRCLTAEVEAHWREVASFQSPDAARACLEWNVDQASVDAGVADRRRPPRRIRALVAANLADVRSQRDFDRFL